MKVKELLQLLHIYSSFKEIRNAEVCINIPSKQYHLDYSSVEKLYYDDTDNTLMLLSEGDLSNGKDRD